MALWPFSKKSTDEPAAQPAGAVQDEVNAATAASGASAPAEDFTTPDPVHDAVNGDIGPYDGDTVKLDDFDFSDFSAGILDLGSIKLAMPMKSEVQVEMGPEGPRVLHVVTEYGRITPVAFAAPRSPGQWRDAAKDIAAGMRNDGLTVHLEHGPWGREVVGVAGDACIRMVGVDGPRWMLRATLAGPVERAEDMAKLGREVIARTFVYRGEAPMMAGNSLPISLPEALANQVRNAMENRDQWLPQMQEMERQRQEEAAAAQQDPEAKQ